MLLVDLMIVNPQGKKELPLLMWFGKGTIATFGAFSCASGLTDCTAPPAPGGTFCKTGDSCWFSQHFFKILSK